MQSGYVGSSVERIETYFKKIENARDDSLLLKALITKARQLITDLPGIGFGGSYHSVYGLAGPPQAGPSPASVARAPPEHTTAPRVRVGRSAESHDQLHLRRIKYVCYTSRRGIAFQSHRDTP